MVLHDLYRIQEQIGIKILKEIAEDITGDKTSGHDQRQTRDRILPYLSFHFIQSIHTLNSYPVPFCANLEISTSNR